MARQTRSQLRQQINMPCFCVCLNVSLHIQKPPGAARVGVTAPISQMRKWRPSVISAQSHGLKMPEPGEPTALDSWLWLPSAQQGEHSEAALVPGECRVGLSPPCSCVAFNKHTHNALCKHHLRGLRSNLKLHSPRIPCLPTHHPQRPVRSFSPQCFTCRVEGVP